MLALARRHCGNFPNGLDFLCADAARLPLASETVDRALAGWVVVNLRPAIRRRVLDEITRVLRRRPGTGLWLIENHWSGEFQELRGRRSEVDQARVRALIDEQGFSELDVVKTELRFPSAGEAERVLGWLCGDGVRRKLHERPVARLTHHVVILHRPAARAER
jgi:ubiquinone/menaquinone biosynthesis C-methylase UbiE